MLRHVTLGVSSCTNLPTAGCPTYRAYQHTILLHKRLQNSHAPTSSGARRML